MHVQTDIHAIANDMRKCFAQCIENAGLKSTEGSCLYGAVLLQKIIIQFTPYQAIVKGGNGDNEGFCDAKGIWHGHYWVEVKSKSSQSYIVDITADQFGAPPVTVLPLELTQNQYIPGNQHLVNEAYVQACNELYGLI